MSSPKQPAPEPAPPGIPDGGEHRSIGRATLVLSALARAKSQGLRLTDVANNTGLGKATAHRFLAGLVANGWVDQDEHTGTFFLGMQLLSWAVAAGDRYGIAQHCAPLLSRLAEKTEDTVYLSLRTGSEAVCIARFEGAFPIKTLTLQIGDRRPLGMGAGSLALLAFLPAEEIEEVLASNRSARERFPLEEKQLRQMIRAARQNGYTFNDERLIRGMSAVGVPVFRSDNVPVAAISVAAIPSRLEASRLKEVVAATRETAAAIEKSLPAILNATVLTNAVR
jgi:DNA-binding IclR family transcriptional regulator